MIDTSFVSPQGAEDLGSQNSYQFYDIHYYICGKSIIHAKYDFSVWFRIGSNPADINISKPHWKHD